MTEPLGRAPTNRARAAFALAVALAVGVYVFLYGRFNPQLTSDFDQVWAAGRAVWHRENPYDVIGYAKQFYWWWPFYYPMPAAVLAAPVGWMPVLAARVVFNATGAGLLAWGATKDGWWRLPLFISIPFTVSIELGQWSTLVTAALFLPALAWVGAAKPNWGVAIVAAAATPRIWKPLLVGAGVLLAASFALEPRWVGDWLAAVRSATHFRAPLVLPAGFLMLAAALRWRRPEARLLLAIACLPQTAGFYDALVLFTIPRTFRQSLALCVATFVVFFAMVFRGPWTTGEAWMHDISRLTLWLLYLPCVALVLTRPNEGTLPLPARAAAR